jgi:hypothetical protein
MGGIEAQSGFYYQNVLGALRALDLIELSLDQGYHRNLLRTPEAKRDPDRPHA